MTFAKTVCPFHYRSQTGKDFPLALIGVPVYFKSDHTPRRLANNLKPATHFIEQYNGMHKEYQSITPPLGIECMDKVLQNTDDCAALYTVALFKIRAK